MVVFYVMSATVLFYSISSIEISKVGKFYSPINMSVGINIFMNGKLDSSFLTFICALLKFQKLSLNVTSATVELPIYKYEEN